MQQKLIKNIWAVGRNYADHAAEMKAEVPKAPFFFLKAGSTNESGSKIKLPQWSKDVHHELEIAYLLDENLSFSHITLALDLTARDAQADAKAKGLPWTLAKSFAGSCPIGSWIDLREISSQESLEIELKKNKKVVQTGNINQMIFKPDFLLNYLKERFPLEPHDVVLTGTPAGVGPIVAGDTLEGTLRANSHILLTCLWDVE